MTILDNLIKTFQEGNCIERISIQKDKKVKLETFKQIQRQLERDLQQLKKEILKSIQSISDKSHVKRQ